MSGVRGGQLKAKRDIRVASIFNDALAAFLRMLVVDELTHLRESSMAWRSMRRASTLWVAISSWSSTQTVADSVEVGRA